MSAPAYTQSHFSQPVYKTHHTAKTPMRLFIIIVMLILAGCNLEASTPAPNIDDIAVSFSTPTANPQQSVSPTQPVQSQPTQAIAPTLGASPGCVVDTTLPRYLVRAGDTLSDIATRSNTTIANLVAINCLPNADQIFTGQTMYTTQLIDPPSAQYYVIFNNDNGRSGIRTGCGDSGIALRSGLELTGVLHQDIRTSLMALFSTEFPPAPYSQTLPSGIVINNVTVTGDLAQITLLGNLQSSGTCHDAQMQAQILLTVFQYTGINRAFITINSQNMRQLFDSSGLVGNNDPYLASDWLP